MARTSTVRYIKRKKKVGGYRKKRKANMPITVRVKNQNPSPLQLTSTFNLEFSGEWDTTVQFDPYLSVAGNQLITGSGTGPLLAGANRFYGTGPGQGGGYNINSATLPTGFNNYIGVTTNQIGLYARYTVTGISYKLCLTPVESGRSVEMIVVPEMVSTVTSTSAYSSITEMQNAPYARNKRASTFSSTSSNTLKGYIDIAKFFGISRHKLLTDTTYSGYVLLAGLVVPGQIVNIQFGLRNGVPSGSVNKTPYSLELRYHVTFNQTPGRLIGD